MLISDVGPCGPIPAPDLCSPPRGWPESFSKDQSLKSFIGAGRLRGKRCRLTTPAQEGLLAKVAAAGVQLAADDSAANAEALRGAMGWSVVKGFAVFELAAMPGVFAAVSRQWNETRGAWVDLTPRPAAHESMVLVESDLGSDTSLALATAEGPAVESVAAAASAVPSEGGGAAAGTENLPAGGVVTANGERWRPSQRSESKASSLSMLELGEAWDELQADPTFRYEVALLRDDAKLKRYLSDLSISGDVRLQLIQTNARGFAALLDELACGPLPSEAVAGWVSKRAAREARSGTDASADQTSPSPVLEASTKQALVRQAELHAAMSGVWRATKGVRHGRIRLRLHARGSARPAAQSPAPHHAAAAADSTRAAEGAAAGRDAVDVSAEEFWPRFELESQVWSSISEEGDASVEFFAPLDEDDEAAAQMRCSGWWERTPYGFTLYLESVAEVGPGVAGLPLREAEARLDLLAAVQAAAGRQLTKELFGTMDFEALTATVGIGELRQRKLVFKAPGK